MTYKYPFPIMLTVLICCGCHPTNPGEAPVSYLVPVMDSCVDEPDHHYQISIPEYIPDGQRLPLILAIDPHGDGGLALEKFAGALVDIPVVIAGSEKLRNNYPTFESSLSNLEKDVLAKYPADPEQVLVAGFSGGARMAFFFGVKRKAKGIIMFGAGPGRSISSAAGTKVYMVSGTRDFNFMEQYLPPFTSLYDEQDHMVDFFRGGHEWPPSENIHDAVAYMLKDDAEFSGNLPVQISQYEYGKFDSLMQAGDLFFAGKALEKAWIFAPDGKRKASMSREINELRNQPGWTGYQQKFEGFLHKELMQKQVYTEKLNDPDLSWWTAEIQRLNQNVNAVMDPVEKDYLFRLKGFIGILLYSRINSKLQDGSHTDEVDRLLAIYALAEPASPDLKRFKERVQHLPGE